MSRIECSGTNAGGEGTFKVENNVCDSSCARDRNSWIGRQLAHQTHVQKSMAQHQLCVAHSIYYTSNALMHFVLINSQAQLFWKPAQSKEMKERRESSKDRCTQGRFQRWNTFASSILRARLNL